MEPKKLSMFMLTILVVQFLSPLSHGQDLESGCPELQASDLGSTSAFSTTGLLADTGDVNPSILILQSNTVCLAQSPVRDRYHQVSVVVMYLRASDSMQVTVQVEYECIAGVWGFGTPSITFSPTADLTTVVRNDCISCIGPATAPSLLVITDEHCVGTFRVQSTACMHT